MKLVPNTPVQGKIVPSIENFPVEIFQWGINGGHYDASKAHSHSFDELMLFEKGGGIHEIGGENYSVPHYSIHLIRSGVGHLLHRANDSSGGTVVFRRAFIFEEPLLPFKDLAFLQASMPVITLDAEAFREIWEVYLILLSETQKTRHYYRKHIFLSWLNTFLVKVAECYRIEATLPKPAANAAQAQSFVQLVEENYRTQKSVAFYAKQLCISPKYLYDICRQHLGKSPQTFIQARVVNEAINQLLQPGKPTKVIASELGFPDPAYFSRFVKNMTGKTPTQWQQQS